VTSASSGPVMSAAFGVGGLWLWRLRQYLRVLQWTVACAVVALSLVMKAPIYYLIARIDIVGGSTGWHRSRLIESALEHFDTWWFAGTDYTRNWMAEGMISDPNHVDITNHYLRLGVVGGLPLIILFMAILLTAFAFVGRAVRSDVDMPPRDQFVLWALGCALFAHATAFISVSYFDQSFVFFYLTLGAIGSARFRAEVTTADGGGRQPPGEEKGRAANAGRRPAVAVAPVVRPAARESRKKVG